MKNLSPESLRAFISVYDLQSFTLAAEHLSRSQPAISLQIKRLEDLIGVKLLEKHGQQLMLTQAGQELYTGARQLMTLHDQLLGKFRQRHVRGQVRLGIPSEFATAVLPRVLGDFANSYPEITLEVTSGLSRDLRLGASRGQFDIILTVAEQAPASAIQVKQDALVWVAGHPEPTLREPLPLVLAAEGCIYRRKTLQALEASERAYQITYTNNDLTGISAALKSNLGITVLAQSSVPADLYELRHTGLPNPGKIGIYLERHGEDNPAAKRLKDYLADYLRNQN